MKNILLLEDDLAMANLYKKKLEKGGFIVKWAKDVQEAVGIAHKFFADCVFIDHGIRGNEQAGTEIIPYFKKNFPKTKLIVLSNYNSTEYKAKSEGADDFLVKINYPPRKLLEYAEKLFA